MSRSDIEKVKKVFMSDEEIMVLLLGLRGLVSYDLLRFCLMKRHRVEFCVAAGSNRNLLAVLF